MTDPLVLVSNRGPVTFQRVRARGRVIGRGSGGLVTALSGLLEATPCVWISAAMSREDRLVAAETGGAGFHLEGYGPDAHGRFVLVESDVYEAYYNVIANPILWFIQHYLWDLSNAPDIRVQELLAWEHGYEAVNRAFADEVARVLDRHPGATVMFHDYHLYTAPALVRESHPDAFLHHFVHVPWSQPDYWRVLPPHIREAILTGLLANDIVAFHTRRYARNFLLCCEDLLGAQVDYRRGLVRWENREVLARAYPISINSAAFEVLAHGPDVAREEVEVLRRRRRQMIVRVDRTDLAKNVLRGFKAFDRFLDLHPEYREEVTFVAQLPPSRQDVDEYVEYAQRIRDLVSHINTKHGNTDWMPIDLRMQHDMPRALALYKHYDAIMVNSIFDGMNLVAKEGPLVNERNGVLILSENTGAHEELGAFAITVNPFDVEDQARAIHAALTMSREDREARAEAIRRIVRENDVTKWLAAQQRDIQAKRSADARRAAKRPTIDGDRHGTRPDPS